MVTYRMEAGLRMEEAKINCLGCSIRLETMEISLWSL